MGLFHDSWISQNVIFAWQLSTDLFDTFSLVSTISMAWNTVINIRLSRTLFGLLFMSIKRWHIFYITECFNPIAFSLWFRSSVLNCFKSLSWNPVHYFFCNSHNKDPIAHPHDERWGILMSLTHWGWDKMDAIFQTPFSNAFSWMINYEFRLEFYWSLFLLSN